MSNNPIKILLVEDQAMVRKALRSLLHEQDDITVVGEASNCRTALEQVKEHAPHVVVMDVHLAHESGIEVSRQILAESPKVKIIALSADLSISLVHEALKAGVTAYISKNDGPEDLKRAIYAVMDQRTYLCPEIASLVVGDYLKMIEGKVIPASKPLLTDREKLLLKLVAEGRRNKEIALLLDVEVKSVEEYRSRLMKKLGCASANELTRYAIREGIVTA